MKLNKTQEVIFYIVELIKSGKKKVNDVLPSEHYVMMKFNCSRITVISAYTKLKTIGAIYSVTKKGYFVAENFYSAISSLSSTIKTDKSTIKQNPQAKTPEWFAEFKIKFDYGYTSYTKKYYKSNKIVMEAQYYVSDKYPIENIQDVSSIIEYFIQQVSILHNVVYKLRYEEVNNWGYNKLVVVYMFGYDDEGIMISAKYVIHPDHFVFNKLEFSIL